MSSLDTTYGAAFIGLILSAVLYGVTLLQTYLYFRQYPNDSWFIKFIVVLLWFLDTLHLVLCSIAIYSYLITNFSNPAALGRSTWSMNLQTDCNGLIGLIVECFFARRVWILSGNYIVTGIIVIFACIHFGLGVLFTVKGFLLVEVDKFPELIWVTSTGLGSAAAADIIIAVALCHYLMKSRTGFARTDSLIGTLIGYSLTTGLITSVIACICVVTFATMPTNYVWLGFFWLIGKCYVNSLLAALSSLSSSYPAGRNLIGGHCRLNSRDFLREQVTPQDNTFLQMTPFRAIASTHGHPQELTPRSSNEEKEGRYMENRAITVSVQTQTVTRMDYELINSSPSSATRS